MSKILNEYGQYNILPDPIMSDNNDYKKLCDRVKKSWATTIYMYEQDIICPLSYSQSERVNPDFIGPKRGSKMLAFMNKYYEYVKHTNFDYSFNEMRWKLKKCEANQYIIDEYESIWMKHWRLQELQQYLGCEPMGNYVMINISPNWKGQKITQHKVTTFTKIIGYYLAEGWYSEGCYAIESGGEGDMLHAHLVLRYDNSPKGFKSTKSHLAKGNHSQQLNKWWNKEFKGDQGLIKGKYAIQKIFLNSNEMILDKIAYCEESQKPEGHKNVDLKGIKGINTKIEYKV